MIKLELSKSIYLIIFILIQNSNISYGQVETALRLDVGFSKIKNTQGSLDINHGISGQVGFVSVFPLNETIVIGTELNLNLIQGREYKEFSLLQQSGITTEHKNNYIRNISYLNLPIYIGFRFKEFQIAIGYQGALKVYDVGKIKGELFINGEWKNISTNESLKLKKTDHGPRISLSYDVSNRISIQALYFHGKRDIVKPQNSYEWNVRQFVVGGLYKLSGYNKRNKKK